MSERQPTYYKHLRQHQRLPLHTPVILTTHQTSYLGETENVSQGGALVICTSSFQPATDSRLRFNLPTGYSVTAACEVVHRQPNQRMGLRFLNMDPPTFKELSRFLLNLQDHMRRGARIAKRFSVALSKGEGQPVEQLAETMVLSRWGGMLVCRGQIKLGEKFYLWWPKAKRGAHAKIVLRRKTAHGGMTELGFQFLDYDNFWGLEFPTDLDQ